MRRWGEDIYLYRKVISGRHKRRGAVVIKREKKGDAVKGGTRFTNEAKKGYEKREVKKRGKVWKNKYKKYENGRRMEQRRERGMKKKD